MNSLGASGPPGARAARTLLAVLSAAALAACVSPAVVVVSRGYDPAQIRRVALADFKDFPGSWGSGEIAASTFEKYLLWAGYSLVERRQVNEILKEQSLGASGAIDPATIRSLGKVLGVDALAFGSLTDFSQSREQTVMVDVPQEQSDPIYGQIVTEQQSGSTTVRTIQNVVTGYSTTQTTQVQPEIVTLPAHVSMSVRLADTQTGEVLWSASSSSDGVDLSAAAEQASAELMQALVKKLQKASSRPK